MKTTMLLAIVALARTVLAQDLADLLTEAQRAYIRGDSAAAKEKFELVRKLEPNNRTATNYLRLIAAEEAKAGPQKGQGNSTKTILETVILPKVELREASLSEALEFLKQKGNQIAEKKIAINFVMQLDEQTKAKKITLALQNVPFTEVLRYIGQLAEVEFVYEPFAVVVKPKGAAAPAAEPAKKADGAGKIPGLDK